jgi:hypothetical protein
MGQTEEVHVTRFVVEGSIEEKMLKVGHHHFQLDFFSEFGAWH